MAYKKKTAQTFKETEIFKEIKHDLLAQINKKDVNRHFVNLIDDYMDLWAIKNLLIEDISKRGVSIKYNNGGGQGGYKKNDSVSELVKINAQMLKILNELGINPPADDGGEGSDL